MTGPEDLIETVAADLERHEGFRRFPYRCAAGRLTIGIGRNLEDRGVSRAEAGLLLAGDIRECLADLERLFPGFPAMAEDWKRALVNMRFNLGPARFRGFRRAIDAVRRDRPEAARRELLDSRWAGQVQPERVVDIAAWTAGKLRPAG